MRLNIESDEEAEEEEEEEGEVEEMQGARAHISPLKFLRFTF